MKNECAQSNLLWVKAILYRIVRMIIVFMASFFVSGDSTLALSIMSIDVVIATLFYYFFDLWWYKIERIIQKSWIKIKYHKL
jgi:uncharacterized membrane protein